MRSATTLSDALKRIAASKARFYSRGDLSTTCRQERKYWREAGLAPWEDIESNSAWYITTVKDDPPTALHNADALGAYIFTDRSSLLRQVARGNVSRTTAFIEPKTNDDPLMSSCYASQNPAQVGARRERVDSFLNYLFSRRGQRLIGSFGSEFLGLPFFVPGHSEFDAGKLLADGRPQGRQWSLRRAPQRIEVY